MHLETHFFPPRKPLNALHWNQFCNRTVQPKEKQADSFTYVCLLTCIFCSGWETRLKVPNQDKKKKTQKNRTIYLLLSSCKKKCPKTSP